MLVFIVFIVSIGSVCAADSSDFSDAISANIDTENSCAIDNVDVLDENNLGLCESQAIAEASDDEQASSDAIGSDDYSDKLSDGDSGTFTDLKNLINSTSENGIIEFFVFYRLSKIQFFIIIINFNFVYIRLKFIFYSCMFYEHIYIFIFCIN